MHLFLLQYSKLGTIERFKNRRPQYITLPKPKDFEESNQIIYICHMKNHNFRDLKSHNLKFFLPYFFFILIQNVDVLMY